MRCGRCPKAFPARTCSSAGTEGHLYMGCGNGDLWRYDGDADTFTPLVQGELNGLCWGGIITEHYVLWNASKNSNPGAVAVYSLDEQRHVKTFAPLDPGTPTALYGHRCVATPDNKVLWGLGTPVARMAVIDLDTLEADVVTPNVFAENTRLNVNMLDDSTLAVFSSRGHGGEKLYLFDYPSFKHIETQDVPMQGGTPARLRLPSLAARCIASMSRRATCSATTSHHATWRKVIHDWTHGYARGAGHLERTRHRRRHHVR